MSGLAPASLLLGAGGWLLSFYVAGSLATRRAQARQRGCDSRRLIEARQQIRTLRDELAARDAELEAIFDNAAAGVVEVEREQAVWRIVRANAVYCRMTGLDGCEPHGRLAADPVHPDDLASEARWDAPAAVGQKFDYERRYQHRDGTVVWGRASTRVLAVSPDGRPSRLFAIVQDCTEQKAAEAALRARDETLRLSLKIGRVASYRRDYRNGLLYCGSEARLMHGLAQNDAPIPIGEWFAMIVPEDQATVSRWLAEAHGRKEEVTEFEYRFMHPVAGLRHLETRSRTRYGDDGKPIESVGVAFDVTERRQAEAKIAHMAHHDALTRLPNRLLFYERLAEAVARGRRRELAAVLVLDLDRFKVVNDTLGHPAGDALLKEVARRMLSEVRETDTVARLGGDEFAIVQTGMQAAEDASGLATRVIAALSAPYEIDGRQANIGVSVGIAIIPGDAHDADQLLKNADLALYQAKGEGRGRYRYFEAEAVVRI